MSAMSSFAGLYYKAPGNETFDPALPWHPIPVHTIPLAQDNMIAIFAGAKCPKADKFRADLIASPEYQHFLEENHDFLEMLANKTEMQWDDFYSIWDVFNTEIAHKDAHRWPAWVTPEIVETIEKIVAVDSNFNYNTDDWQRLVGGPLLGDILRRLKAKAAGDLDPRLKYYVYSGHDATLWTMLKILGASNGLNPPYASLLLLELHYRQGQHYVEAYFRNSTHLEQPEPAFMVGIDGCPYPCTLEQFETRSKPKVPTDWEAECKL